MDTRRGLRRQVFDIEPCVSHDGLQQPLADVALAVFRHRGCPAVRVLHADVAAVLTFPLEPVAFENLDELVSSKNRQRRHELHSYIDGLRPGFERDVFARLPQVFDNESDCRADVRQRLIVRVALRVAAG